MKHTPLHRGGTLLFVVAIMLVATAGSATAARLITGAQITAA